jgi:hypothetical protein
MEGMNKTGNGPALQEQGRSKNEDYGPSEGGALNKGVAYAQSLDGTYPGADTNSETSGPGQMKPGHFKGSADRGCNWG